MVIVYNFLVSSLPKPVNGLITYYEDEYETESENEEEIYNYDNFDLEDI